MVTEFWGTLSIYDHRNPIFIRSLILFDRIVIPVPEAPIGDQTTQEIDRLFADATYLQDNGAAIIYKFNPDEFSNWQSNILREALTVNRRDNLYDTRLMLKTMTEDLKPKDVYEVTAVPVYGARETFTNAYSNINPVTENNLLLELSHYIDVPDQQTPLEAIIHLRNEDSFQSARRALRDWQFDKMPKILEGNSAREILLSKQDFDLMLKRYQEEISKAKFNKTTIVVTSLITLGALFSAAFGQMPTAIALMSGAAPNLFSLIQSSTPSWKDLREKKYEAAGVIFEANRVLKL